jgi:hypothetical protein
MILQCNENGDNLDAAIFQDQLQNDHFTVTSVGCHEVRDLAARGVRHFGTRVYIHPNFRDCFQARKFLDSK